MALPKISVPIFTTELPSTGAKVKYRPFTVAEEKILLIARESNDADQIIIAVKQILNNCVVDDLDVEKLPTFDIEWLLVHIRAASIDNNVEFQIRDPDTEEIITLEMRIEDIKLHRNPEHTNKIKADDTYTILMRYPTIDESIKLIQVLAEYSRLQSAIKATDPDSSERKKAEIEFNSFNKKRVQIEFDITIGCMDKLVGDDQIFDFSDSTPKEVNAFVDSLDARAVERIKTFFETMPILRHEIKYKNKKGDEKTFVIQGLNSFFQ